MSQYLNFVPFLGRGANQTSSTFDLANRADGKLHGGNDYAAPLGQTVYAGAGGTVIWSGFNPGGHGWSVVIKDESGNSTLYSHMGTSSTTRPNGMPAVGSVVQAGDVIGGVGNTGSVRIRQPGNGILHVSVYNVDATAELEKNQRNSGNSVLPITKDPDNISDVDAYYARYSDDKFIGTDASGNTLIARSSGTVQTGDYGRIIEVRDRTSGALVDTYGQTFTALKNAAGETTAFRIINKNGAGQDIVIDTVTPTGESLRHEVLNGQGQTNYVRQSGIDVYTTADGSRQAYIAGVVGPLPVNADGSIALATSKGDISFRLSDNPMQGGTCSAGSETYQLNPGESVTSCFGGVMIQGVGTGDQATDIFLDGTGKGLKFEYEVDPFQFGENNVGWKLASVDPVLLNGGTMTDVSPGLFTYDADDLYVAGDSNTGEFKVNFKSDAAASGAIDTVIEKGINGNVTIRDFESGSLTLQDTIPSLIDALSLLKAIQSGQPLPIVASGLKLANGLVNTAGKPPTDYTLSGTANAVSGVLSLMSLDAALKRGDTLGAINAGAQAITFGATAYANFAGKTFEGAIEAQTFGSAGGTLGMIGKALPYLSLVNSIAKGDPAGAAIAGLQILATNGLLNASLTAAVPVIGWAYAIYSIMDSLLSDGPDIPDPWGTGSFVWDGNGIAISSAGETGGNEAVSNVMNNVLATLNALIVREHEQNPNVALGVIPNRMPGVGYDMSGFRYTAIDPLTGAESHPALRFDTAGRPYNAEAGTPESYQSLTEGLIRSALARGALAPLWEVQTAKLQTDAGDPKAGLTEEERAGRDGQLAAALTGTTQVFRPVALDLDGDGIEITDKAHGTAFDVDDSGFLKQTAWVKSDDAMLTLDRNYNGSIDSGRELFSNATVALGRRGLAGMAWVDSNYDGKLTAADPVWSELKVWRDLNQDGVQEAGESQSLSDLGISELNYAMGTFTQAGQARQLGSPDLEADKDGTRVTVVPEGILVLNSADNKLSLVVTQIDDETLLEPNRDGITGYEDTEVIVGSTDLLANDTLGGIPGSNLQITGVSNFRHGTGYLDANGFVHFNPEANYNGTGAGFEYAMAAVNGQTGTAGVDINLQSVNDAPTLDHVDHGSRPIYGYTPVQYMSMDEWGNGSQYLSGGNAIYQPYGIRSELVGWNDSGGYVQSVVYNPPAGQWNMEYHTTPIAFEDTGSGQITATDIDDAASSLTYEIVNQPQYGSASLNPDGTFQYTSWKEPGVASDRIVVNGQYGATKDGTLYTANNLPSQAVNPSSDVFHVRITDPQGGSTIQSISVPHYGPYLPPTPAGGGGGKKPIAVDLDGNGFQFVNVNDSNVFFDVNGDGWKHRTSWVGKDDGLLAYDIDGDGKIDKAGEISFARYKDGAQTDLEGLSFFDSNGDGRFDSADEKWSKFGVWQDANQDGITDDGEFHTLSELGITAVQLTSDGHFQVINGQTVHGIGAMAKSDGSELAIADVTLAYSNETRVPQLGGGSAVVATSPFSPSGEEINGTPDKDLILGKNGNNIVNGYAGDDVVFEDGGNDIIDAGEGNDLVYAGADNDLVLGGTGDDAIYAGEGSDIVFGGDGHDAIFAEGGNDVVFGGAGNDLIASGLGNDVLSGDDGDDQVYGESGNDALFGRDGNDELLGMDDYDRLDGGNGNDLLDGGSGADEMLGGAGDDTYVVDDANDQVTELVNEGNDTVRTALNAYALTANVENLILTGTTSIAGSGNDLDNRLTGNVGTNTLAGGAGNDTLDGGLGADTLVGGTGDDLYLVDNVGDTVIEQAGEGGDTVKASVTFSLSDHVENLTLTGTQAIDGTGNNLDNSLLGNAADNRLDGGAGVDTLAGGLGNDTYVIDNSGDVIVEGANAGLDTVVASFDYTLGETLENLALTGTADLTGEGNALDNTLSGNAGNNLLDGGIGADTLVGGAGDDTYLVDNVGDKIIEAAGLGNDTVITGVSHTLADYVENLLLTGTANLNGTGNGGNNTLTGNAGANQFSGGAGADVLIGSLGNDTLDGGTGNDLYSFTRGDGNDILVDHDTTTGNVDTLRLSNIVPDDLLVGIDGNDLLLEVHGSSDTLRIRNGALNGGSGADAIERIEFGDGTVWAKPELWQRLVQGTAGNDTLRGLDFSETFYAQAGCDTITAGGGHDTVYAAGDNDRAWGGAGDDRLYGQDGDDELHGDGGSDLLSGDKGNDRLYGDAGSDTLDGGEGVGADTLYGGSGGDSYRWGRNLGNDTIIEADGGLGGSDVLVLDAGIRPDDLRATRQGNDLLLVTADNAAWLRVQNHYTTEGRLETIRFADGREWNVDDLADLDWRYTIARADGTVTGNALNDVIKGGSGDDTLDGGSGDDIIRAGAGEDTVYGGLNNDTLSGGTGNDRLYGQDGDDQLNGDDGSDLLSGDKGNDRLYGGAGSDTLDGGEGAGADTLYGGSGGDNYRWGRGLGNDTLIEADGGLGGNDVLVLDAGIRPDDLRAARQGNDLLLTTADNANWLRVQNHYTTEGRLETIRFADGREWNADDLADVDWRYTIARADGTVAGNYLNEIIKGGSGNDTLDAGIGDDLVRAGAGDDRVILGQGNDIGEGGLGNDTLDGGDGCDTLRGDAGNDVLQGSLANDTLDGGDGLDWLAGGVGDDQLTDLAGNNLGEGGDGNDRLTLGAGADIVLGGRGYDTINLGSGADLLLFNKGDSVDTVTAAAGRDNAISLGGGIRYADLGMSRSGADLVLDAGATDRIVLRDWYATSVGQTVSRLQVVTEGTTDYLAGSTDPLRDQKVEQFDFARLAAAFDQAQTKSPGSRWSVMNGLLDAHLASSDSAALGGEPAMAYAREGSLTATAAGSVQSVLRDGQFASQVQSVGSRFDGSVQGIHG